MKLKKLHGGIEQEIEYDEKGYPEITRLEYETINRVIDIYLQKLNFQSVSYFGFDNNERVSIYTDDEKKQNIIEVLSNEFVENNNITLDNINNYVDIVGQELYFAPIKIKNVTNELQSQNINIKRYVANGIMLTTDYEHAKEITLIVNINYDNKVFSLEPVKNEQYDEIKSLQIMDSLEKNDNNVFTYGRGGTENIVRDYINNYKKISLTKPEVIYNFMSEEYREKRFKTLDNFKKYVENNKEEIKNIDFSQYLARGEDGIIEYVGKDQYGNLYIFRENAILDYTIELDDYTLDYKDEDYLEEYNSSTEQYKVANNINKWVKMINNRDYQSAYEVLDKTFRENEFGDIETFESYMREAFPYHYNLEFDEFAEEGKVYTQKIILTNVEAEGEDRIEKTIIMSLKDDVEFVMSFNITRGDNRDRM